MPEVTTQGQYRFKLLSVPFSKHFWIVFETCQCWKQAGLFIYLFIYL